MKTSTKEIILPIVLLIVSYLIWNQYLQFFKSTENTTIDINIYDTYFVIEATNILILFISLVFLIVYLVRILISRFRNIIINSVFLLSNLTMIVIVSFVLQLLKTTIKPGWTIYPPLSANLEIDQTNGFEKVFHFLIGIQIFLTITIILAAVKTGINIWKGTRA